MVYTPRVASSSFHIKDYTEEIYKLTSKNNTVAVIGDDKVVLGLGDIGPLVVILDVFN